jgi:uncharacterized repeat protein (TIGR02543 family)
VVEQPTDVAGGFGLTCAQSDNPSDSTKSDFTCAFANASGQKFEEKLDLKLDFFKVELDGQQVNHTMLLVDDPQVANTGSEFKFSVLKSDAPRIILTFQFSNPQNQHQIPNKDSRRLTSTIAPAFEIPSKDFSVSFDVKINLPSLVMSDPKFKEIRYTADTSGKLNCTSDGIIYTGSINIPNANTTLMAIHCDDQGEASAISSVTYTYKSNVTHNLTTSVSGSGSIGKNPDKITFDHNEVVTLIAAADAGYSFTGWSGACSGTSLTCNVTMDGAKSAVATFTIISSHCSNGSDCYAGISSIPIGTEIPGPSGSTLKLEFANGIDGFKVWREKNSPYRILNASGKVTNGWQKKLSRSGTAFSGIDMTDGNDIKRIAGRVCPKYVFLSHSQMTATQRCLYYDSGNLPQTFDRDFSAAGAVEAEDWLRSHNSPNTGRGVGSSYYEGNIRTCADKGMRLPVLYETSADIQGSFAAPDLPTGDPGINALVTPWSPGFSGLDLGPGNRLTASANPSGGCPTDCYSTWAARGVFLIGYNNPIYSVTCVLPSH